MVIHMNTLSNNLTKKREEQQKRIAAGLHPITGEPVIPVEINREVADMISEEEEHKKKNRVLYKMRIASGLHPITGEPVIPVEINREEKTKRKEEIKRKEEKLALQQKRITAGLHPITGKRVKPVEATLQEIKLKKLTERKKTQLALQQKRITAGLHPITGKAIKGTRKPRQRNQIENPIINSTSVINKVESVIGTSYHRLTYIGFGDKRRTIKVKCECGTIKDIKVQYIHFVKSCGCMCKEEKPKSPASKTATHGLSRTIEYQVWHNMHCRCYKSNNKGFKNRGKLGIEVCERWHDVETFIKDVGLRPSPSHVFRRINKNKNYTPDNYHWIIPE